MEQYYDINKLKEMIEAKAQTMLSGAEHFYYIVGWLTHLPPADVVPRAEVEATLKCYKDTVKEEVNQLEYKLAGVMHSVDKWLDGEELNQDEVNRAATMREKTLRIVEGLQAEVERLTVELQAMRTAANAYKMHYENLADEKK